MEYKPYTMEWSRKRYLSEAIQKYFYDESEPEVVVEDILDILEELSSLHKKNLDRITKIKSKFSKEWEKT